MDDLTLSIAAFCKACSVGRTKAYELIASGELEPVKLGRRTLITKRSIDALIERGAAAAQSMRAR